MTSPKTGVPIQRTADYKIFKSHEKNRPIEESKVKKIINSIKADNLLEFRPIVVDGQMRVIDGQHRLAAAKILGLDIYYQINKEAKDEDMIIMQLAQSPWAPADFFHYYVSSGNENYVRAKSFMEEYKLDMRTFCTLLGMSGGQAMNLLKRGKFVFPEGEEYDSLIKVLDNLDTILAVVNQFAIQERALAATVKFKRALISFLKLEDVDPETLIRRIRSGFDKLHLCANIPAYFLMIQDLYNWKNKDPVVEKDRTVARGEAHQGGLRL